MKFISEFKKNIFDTNEQNFENKALQLFYFQAENNPVYKKYLKLIGWSSKSVNELKDIPFLPIDFFKTHIIRSTKVEAQKVFVSSGTINGTVSKHYISDIDFYYDVTKHIFEAFYGVLEEFTVLGLLPSYLERKDSSLVHMIDQFIKVTGDANSGFYLDNMQELTLKLKQLIAREKKVLLIGVSFAFFDLIESIDFKFNDNITIMETGGMKGKRKEITRLELHNKLICSFGCQNIHTEYGMTELISQAYSKDNGILQPPPWMKIYTRDINDPFNLEETSKGPLNIIDLANVDSCAFLETQDIGTIVQGGFEILGRMDNSDVRGCSLMI